MPIKSPMKERTISFYEIVQLKEGEQLRMEHQPWPEVLGYLARADLAARTWDGGDRTIIGQVYPLEEVDRLILHKLRDDGDWLSRVNFDTGQVDEVEASAGTGLLDSSAIQFVDFGNVVALMMGSGTAPTHKSLEGWLNKLDPFGGMSFVVRPLVTPGQLERLKSATEVSRFEIRLGAHQARALSEKKGTMAQWLSRTQEFGDVDVTVVISVPRRKELSPRRHQLAQELQDIADVIPSAAEAAKATLYHGPADDLSAAKVTELVEHNITAKRNVRAVDEAGKSIRVSGAFVVMDAVIYELQDQLRAAADVV